MQLREPRPFTGRHMLLVTLLFFGVIIIVNVIMATIATGTFPGLVVENSYVASQNYNELMASARKQAEAGWHMELAAPRGLLEARLSDRDHPARAGLAVTALAGRPSSTQADKTIDLVADGTVYRAADALPSGQWDVDVEARSVGVLVFRELRRIYVEPGAAP
jgi:nitrogen fixation protein FixH